MPTNQSIAAELRLSEATEQFLDYARVELQFGQQTIDKYAYCLKRVRRRLGDLPVTEVTAADIVKLESQMLTAGNSVCWQVVVLAATKRLLQFCRDRLALPVLDADVVTIPKRPRREVIYLTADEVDRFVRAIPLKTAKSQPHRSGLRFRTLVEVL